MPNILLTNYCNRNCPYCFAKASVALGTASGQWEMSQAELETVLRYLGRERGPVSLLGGEPTLHSRYADIVRWLAEQEYDIKVFTNGTTPQLRESLPPASQNLFAVILNLNHPDTYTRQEWTQIEANGRCLGSRLSLSFNVFTTPFSWEYLREAIVAWKLNPVIRIGLAQPIHGTPNAFLAEAQMDDACCTLVAMAEALACDGIRLGFDCGFRLCMFSPEQRGILAECGTRFLFDCKPILDIGPNLAVWRCFPFSSEPPVKLTDFDSLHQVEEHFERRWARQQARGNTAACRSCRYRRMGTCRGGCLSRTLSLSRREGEDV
jgi:radical SAM protein with 4Fe4S-binding SPASM domain